MTKKIYKFNNKKLIIIKILQNIRKILKKLLKHKPTKQNFKKIIHKNLILIKILKNTLKFNKVIIKSSNINYPTQSNPDNSRLT